MSGDHIPLILGAAVLTYLTRLSGLSIGRRHAPEAVRIFLGYVPIAVFAALVVPDLTVSGSDRASKLIGAAIAGLVAYRIGTLWACILAGMAVSWLTRWIA
jgi:branched-subunit amino acid transport protein